jgi:16S rRNA (cytosine1402-N4)-methyltransferase
MTSPEVLRNGAAGSTYHIPVLCEQVVDLLVTDRTGLYVDGTVGGGGHAARLCAQLEGTGELVGLDADQEALEAAAKRLGECRRARLVQANFRDLGSVLRTLGLGSPSGLLLDLGVSSRQLDEPARGFSFRAAAPLDMRFDRRQSFSALDVVNTYDEARLADVLFRFGEERASRAIARGIAVSRPLRTTDDLASAVERAVGARFLVKSLARVFQAVRIEVNQELAVLASALRDGTALLARGGRIAVISYHSLEDRIVKEAFRSFAATSVSSGTKLAADRAVDPLVRIVTRRPVVPEEDECRSNPRARSAKLRVAERV